MTQEEFEMQWSEMVAGGGLLMFFVVLGGMAVWFLWRAKKLDHETPAFPASFLRSHS